MIVCEVFKVSFARHRVGHGLLRRLDGLLVREHLVDVASVMRRRYYWLVGGGDATSPYRFPVHIAEEWVTHDVRGVVRPRAESLGLVAIQQRSQQALRLSAEVLLHGDRHVHDVIHHLLSILLVVRRSPTQHLIDKGAQTPPVCRLAVTNSLDNLWGEVLGRSAVRVSASPSLVRLQALLGQTEIGDLHVALVVEKHVFGLQVSVNDAVLVETAKSFHQLGCVEAGASLAELLVLAQVVEKLSTVEEVHHEVELRRRLKGVVQLHDEWTVYLFKDVTLSLRFDE